MSRQAPAMAACHVIDLNISASPKMEDSIEVKTNAGFNFLDFDGGSPGVECRIELRGEGDTYYSVAMKVRASFLFGDDWGEDDRREYLASEAPARVFDFARTYLAQATASFPYGPMQVPPVMFGAAKG